jgi:inosose dehydratase
MADFMTRVSGAPISWGVSEQPSWGVRIPARRVLDELVGEGLAAIEHGDTGFFPIDDAEANALFAEYDVAMIAAFVPLLLHDADRREEALTFATAAARRIKALGGSFFVTAAVYEYDWRTPEVIAPEQYRVLAESLKRVDDIAEAHGLMQVLHPHLNTVVETKRDVELALEASDVRICMDSGHLAIGGVDPISFCEDFASRIAHAHLKDVDMTVAPKVLSRELPDMKSGVAAGLFQPFGEGDIAINECVFALENAGYNGWYVMEQDTFVPQMPAENEGPVVDLRTSLAYLRDRVMPRLT